MLKTLGLPQFLTVVIVAIALILSWDFGHRILEIRQLAQAVQAADLELAQVTQANVQLKELLQDVTSTPWLIREARVRFHWTRQGETVVIPIQPPAKPAAAPTPRPLPLPERPVLQDLFDTLFGGAP